MMNTEPEITPETQAESYSFSKAKLPKELNYPLKRSLLDAALRSASVYQTVWFVRYLGRRNGNTVLNAHIGPEQYSDAAAGRVMLTVWAVPAKDRRVTEDLLLNQGLPLLCKWLERVESEGNAWRGFVHSLIFERIVIRCRAQSSKQVLGTKDTTGHVLPSFTFCNSFVICASYHFSSSPNFIRWM